MEKLQAPLNADTHWEFPGCSSAREETWGSSICRDVSKCWIQVSQEWQGPNPAGQLVMPGLTNEADQLIHFIWGCLFTS